MWPMRTLAIAAIVSVAVMMGVSSIAPALAAEPPTQGPPETICNEIADKLHKAGVDAELIEQILLLIPMCSQER